MRTPTLAASLVNHFIVKIVSGYFHDMALTDTGEVLTWYSILSLFITIMLILSFQLFSVLTAILVLYVFRNIPRYIQ